jgi:cold shock protein
MQGTVKKLTDKGFGFIAVEGEEGKDLFFHMSAVQGVRFDDLREGDNVTFDREDTPRGPAATNVSLAQGGGGMGDDSGAGDDGAMGDDDGDDDGDDA